MTIRENAKRLLLNQSCSTCFNGQKVAFSDGKVEIRCYHNLKQVEPYHYCKKYYPYPKELECLIEQLQPGGIKMKMQNKSFCK